MTQDHQKLHERRVFLSFAKNSPIEILEGSLRQDEPPAPDISVNLLDGSAASFELTEIVDQELMARVMRSMRAQSELYEAFRRASPAVRGSVSGRSILVKLRTDASMRRFPQTADLLLRELSQIDKLHEGLIPLSDELARELEKTWTRPWDIVVNFDVSNYGAFGDQCLDSIRAKLTKSYDAEGGLHLLAYYYMQSKLPYETAQERVREYIDSALGSSQFEEVWVYDYNGGTVVDHYSHRGGAM